MSRRPPRPDPDEPLPKPAADMSPEERAEAIRRIRAELRGFDKARRERRIRQGRAKPKTMREMEIFGADLLKHSKAEAPRDDPLPDA